MKSLLTATTFAALFIVGGIYASEHSSAEDTQPCVGQNCPGKGAPGTENPAHKKSGGGTNQNGQGTDQNNQGMNNQGTDENSGQMGKKKKYMQGSGENNMQGSGEDNQMGDQTMHRKKRASNQNNNDVDVNVRTSVDAGGGKWQFDPGRHQRRHSKSASFRFYYQGYWYPQPYWEVYSTGPRYRVSCGEGRAIVADSFSRVRVVECDGGTYTYLGRRNGDTYHIMLNARTGRIVGRALI